MAMQVGGQTVALNSVTEFESLISLPEKMRMLCLESGSHVVLVAAAAGVCAEAWTATSDFLSCGLAAES